MTTFLVNIDVPDIQADDLRNMILDGMGYPLHVDDSENDEHLAVVGIELGNIVVGKPDGASNHVEVLSAGNPRAG